MPARSSTLRRVLILAAGWLFVFLGVLGLFLPILPGILFLMVGLYLLSLESERAQRLRHRLHARYPKLAEHTEQAKDWAERQWDRLRRPRP